MKERRMKSSFWIFALFFVGYANAVCKPNFCNGHGECFDSHGIQYCRCYDHWTGAQCQYRDRCEPNPCQNGATCQPIGVNNFKCVCPLGFKESLCEVRQPTICDETPCRNGGNCVLTTALDKYECKCPTGFKGTNCESVDYCAHHPCANNGTCIANAYGFQCECPRGFAGRTCAEDVNECDASPCVRGTCTNTHGSYRCACPQGFAGQNCEAKYVPCSPSPCQNKAVCVTYAHEKYQCECFPGFTGRHCEVNIDDCLNHDCDNGGTCVDGLGHYTCKCPAAYHGSRCELDVDECQAAGKCQNGGTCVNTPGGYHCICVNGWEGRHCESNRDDCVGNPCINGGTCIDHVAKFSCECPVGKTGLLCHLDDACMSNPCKGGAMCDTSPVDGSYRCSCPRGFTGADCSLDVNECEKGNPCAHGGTCVNTPGAYHCACLPGYTDQWCTTNINECEPNPCENDATCLDDIGVAKCVCMPGFTGQHCEIDQRPLAIRKHCDPNPCRNAGKCIATKIAFRCECPVAFVGETCSTPRRALPAPTCNNVKCENGGICRDGACSCAVGFGGDRCEHRVDVCHSHTCAPGARCVPSRDFRHYTCECPTGFAGRDCHEEMKECAANPCQHGGVCTDRVNGFVCACSVGYTGVRCETNIDDCQDSPCLNEGICIDEVHGFACHCPVQYSGERCEHRLDPCRESRCDNGAVCKPTADYRNYTCACPDGFQGMRCQQDVDECAVAGGPCKNGASCVNTHGSYRCVCVNGFTGRNCEGKQDDCISNPCLNGGLCVDESSGFRCECRAGFTGAQCATNIDECADSPCENGATCVDAVNRYECVCKRGFSGRNCHVNDDDCQEGLCLNGGTCVDGVNAYRCRCARGFTGKNCQISIELDVYNETDRLESQLCRKHECTRKAKNGICDAVCNYYACGYDGGDCSAGTRPFDNCTSPSYCAHVFRDGKCDQVCNNEACLFDGFDCDTPADRCNPIYREFCGAHYADGHCDSGCNTAGCGWDGGDCDQRPDPDQLSGDVVMILLISPQDFVSRANQFLMTLSRKVRAAVRIKTRDGRPMIYPWNSRDGAGDPVVINDEKLATLMTAYPRHKRENDEVLELLSGVMVFVTVDVSMCRKQDRDDCFSDIVAVASYLGAANAKQDLQELGMPMYSAIAQQPSPRMDGAGDSRRVVALSALVGCVLVIAVAIVTTRVTRKRKQTIKAPVWHPPPLNEKEWCGSFMSGGDVFGTVIPTKRHRPDGQSMCAGGNNGVYQALSTISNDSQSFILSSRGSSGTGGHFDARQAIAGGDDAATIDVREWNRLHREAASARRITLPIEKNLVNEAGKGGRTPLMELALNTTKKSEEDIAADAQALVDSGAAVNAIDDGENTALMLAVKRHRFGMVRVLLNAHADPMASDEHENSPLHIAVALEDTVIAEMLLAAGAHVEAVDKDNRTPLMVACKAGHDDMSTVRLLLAAKADPCSTGEKNQPRKHDGRTPLHHAAHNGHVGLVELLIQAGANKDAQDGQDQTPLFLAASEGHFEVCELLLRHGASKEIIDQREMCPKDVAFNNHRTKLVQLFDSWPPRTCHLPSMPALASTSTMQNGTKPKPPRRNGSQRTTRAPKREPVTAAIASGPYSSLMNSGSGFESAMAGRAMAQQGRSPSYCSSMNGAVTAHGGMMTPPQSSDGASNYSTTPSPPGPHGATSLLTTMTSAHGSLPSCSGGNGEQLILSPPLSDHHSPPQMVPSQQQLPSYSMGYCSGEDPYNSPGSHDDLMGGAVAAHQFYTTSKDGTTYAVPQPYSCNYAQPGHQAHHPHLPSMMVPYPSSVHQLPYPAGTATVYYSGQGAGGGVHLQAGQLRNAHYQMC